MVIMAALSSQAQTANSLTYPIEKIQVELNIKPSQPGFSAGISIVDTTARKLKLWIGNTEAKKCLITIQSDSGILYQSTHRNPWYSQVFDLSQLTDGKYHVRINLGKTTIRRNFTITSNTYTLRQLTLR